GKINRKALPAPENKSTKKYTAPRNEIEEKIVQMFAGLLDIEKEKIGIDDSFFHLGGHSLKATRLVSKIHKQLEVNLTLSELFKKHTVRSIAATIEKSIGDKTTRKYQPIEPAPKRENYPLSSTQKRIYILQQKETATTAYNIATALNLTGSIETAKIEKAFKEIIKRHESLRTTFEIIAGEPVQQIHDETPFEIEKSEIEGSEETGNGDVTEIIKNVIRPFDLSRAPLLRVALVKTGKEKHQLQLEIHHIIADGTSMGILATEFMALYEGKTLTPLRVQYKDYSHWQENRKQSEKLKKEEAYWQARYAGEIPVIQLPYDYPRPVKPAFTGKQVQFQLEETDVKTLKGIAIEENSTLYMIILVMLNILLAKLSGNEDIIIGTPIEGRRHDDLTRIIGMFVNTLAIRQYPKGEKKLGQYIREVTENTTMDFENQEYPFEDLVEKLAVKGETARNPLFDIMYTMQNMEIPHITIPGVQAEPVTKAIGETKFDLTILCEEKAGSLCVTVEYSTELFKEETLQRFMRYIKQLAATQMQQGEQKISEVEIIPAEEKREILFDFNSEASGFISDKTIYGLFEEQVEKTPGKIAVTSIEQGTAQRKTLTYRELNENSNRLARNLRKQGEGNQMVGILVDRTVEMIVGLLGILKTGSAYVPLNPKAPAERNRYILDECNSKRMLTTHRLAEITEGNFTTKELIYLEEIDELKTGNHEKEEPIPQTGGTDYAYVIFTSGSTGKPKGVPVTHSNLSPLLHWGYREMGLGSNDRALQNLSYYFDWSVWEIFLSLTSGTNLYMITEEQQMNPEACNEIIRENKITLLHVTPTQWQYLLKIEGGHESIRHLCIGAEKLTLDLVERSIETVTEECRIYNMYGPTEATIISAILEIDKTALGKYKNLSSVPIGKPVGNTQLLILDKNRKPVPLRVEGELYIGGEGITRGYLNKPEQTAKQYIKAGRQLTKALPNNQTPITNSKLYRTGDRARWQPDGTIEYLGRFDFQVKIRGFRIELGEIENQILTQEDIKEAVVTVKEDEKGDKHLCAYIVKKTSTQSTTSIPSTQSTPSTQAVTNKNFLYSLRQHLAQKLPTYMIPGSITTMEKMPLNPNGKVDLKALPEPETGTAGTEYTAPGNELEKKLVHICSQILNIQKEKISITNNIS
ncbi:MAG: amino acid adenylation domain-containing protein, partial [bacterium]|nr:amino acid adenylation domain-containing protein [bacterium]